MAGHVALVSRKARWKPIVGSDGIGTGTRRRKSVRMWRSPKKSPMLTPIVKETRGRPPREPRTW